MSKRRRHLWDDEAAYQFTNHQQPLRQIEEDIADDTFEMEDLEHEVGYIEEAHEALSKLFTKSNKRSTHMKGVRRKDAWH